MCQVLNGLQDYLLRIISGEKKGVLPALIRLLLSFLEIIYFLIINMAYFLYHTGIKESKELPCRVISIGNITTGGPEKLLLLNYWLKLLKKIIIILLL